ncbi:MAG: hypothetical protein A3F12_06160 [Gammaproteobacteria bacterium RIFCSPHIGHO2_12_FULL_38_14]|nr:MAG: hypothetical protein A3F12_06160 [Gammaproteobacteria bacterium RIFCSPHIGHO2_12_FULL_38_14]
MKLLQKINIKNIAGLILLSCLIMACTPNEEVWTGRNRNPIQVVCGPACQTIVFPYRCSSLTLTQKKQIKRFVYKRGRHTPIYVSVCASNSRDILLNEARVNAIKAEIKRLGYKPVRLKPTLPADLETTRCVNLVRGKVRLYVQHCPNNTWPPSVQSIGSNFGCTTNYNLAQMVIDPWDFLATPGDNGTEGSRIAIGVKNYREGVESKLDMESSTEFIQGLGEV